MVVAIKGQKWSGQFLVFVCCHHGKVPRSGRRWRKAQCQPVGWNWSSTLMHHNLSKDHAYISGITCCLPSWGQKLVHLALPGGLQNTHESKGHANVWQVCCQRCLNLMHHNQSKEHVLITGITHWNCFMGHTLVLLGVIEGSCLSQQSAWVAVRVCMPNILSNCLFCLPVDMYLDLPQWHACRPW
jgi:hypothetical protein